MFTPLGHAQDVDGRQVLCGGPGDDQVCIDVSVVAGPAWANFDSIIGGGTVVVPGGERFLFQTSDLEGAGGELSLVVRNAFEGFSPYLDVRYARFTGDDGNDVLIGPGQPTTGIGLTFLEPDAALGTGLGTTSDGFGLRGSGDMALNYVDGTIGTFVPFFKDLTSSPPGGGVRVEFGLGVRVAVADIDADGRTDVISGGSPLPDFFQVYDYSSRDRYWGLTPRVVISGQATDKLTLFLDLDTFFAYHNGEGSVLQETSAGSDLVAQSLSYEKDGFVLGGSLDVGGSYQFASNAFVNLKYSLNVIPEVTTVHMPANPSEQPARFTSDTAIIHGLNIGLEFRY